MKLIFVRHGETNLRTGTLTKSGIKEIKSAAKYLKNEKIDAIYCSPKARTIQTANILKSQLKAEIFIESSLNERQILTPSQHEKFSKEFDENYLNYSFQTNNFETCKDFIDRNFKTFRAILAKSKSNSTVVIAAHSSTLYAINAYINGIPEDGHINWLQCNTGAVIKYFV